MTLMPAILFLEPNCENLLLAPFMTSAIAASFLRSSHSDHHARQHVMIRPDSVPAVMPARTLRAPSDWLLSLAWTASLAAFSDASSSRSFLESATACTKQPHTVAFIVASLAMPMRIITLFVASFWLSLQLARRVSSSLMRSAFSVSNLVSAGSLFQIAKISPTSLPSCSMACLVRTPRAFLSCEALYSASRFSDRSRRSMYSPAMLRSSFIWRQQCSHELKVIPRSALPCPPQSASSTFCVFLLCPVVKLTSSACAVASFFWAAMASCWPRM
mmetsp:Transcript_80915/g.208320  ORF Transcript_80915/g.208320 Transcript_80915/m.208320 type:complete len:273 (+) Transcript_80915:671-1489(+)